MIPYRNLIASIACSLVAAVAFGAPPETLKMHDLVNRPDRLPPEVTLTKDLRFQGGKSVKAGQKVKVIQFDGATVGVNAGEDEMLGVDVADCDLLAAANAAWTKLTPAQRAVEPTTLVNDPSIWPEKVTLLTGFQLQGGQAVAAAGSELDVYTITSEGVQVKVADSHTIAALGETDAVARAREAVLIPIDKRPSRIARALRGQMVDAAGKPADDAKLDETKVFALYYGASWCPPCRTFSPELVKFVNKVAAKNPHLTVVMISNDKEDAEMYQYMKEEKMPWNAVPIAVLTKSPVLGSYTRGGIPQFVIVDRHGKILAEAFRNGQYMGPKVPLAALTKLLDTGAAK